MLPSLWTGALLGGQTKHSVHQSDTLLMLPFTGALLLYRWGFSGSEKSGGLLKVTQLMNNYSDVTQAL